MRKVKQKFKISIRGDIWTILVFTKKEFEKGYPATLACTIYDHRTNFRTIEFSYAGASKDTIAHELLHAYLSYYNCRKRKFTSIEEDFCEILGKIHKRYYRLINFVYKKIKGT